MGCFHSRPCGRNYEFDNLSVDSVDSNPEYSGPARRYTYPRDRESSYQRREGHGRLIPYDDYDDDSMEGYPDGDDIVESWRDDCTNAARASL